MLYKKGKKGKTNNGNGGDTSEIVNVDQSEEPNWLQLINAKCAKDVVGKRGGCSIDEIYKCPK